MSGKRTIEGDVVKILDAVANKEVTKKYIEKLLSEILSYHQISLGELKEKINIAESKVKIHTIAPTTSTEQKNSNEESLTSKVINLQEYAVNNKDKIKKAEEKELLMRVLELNKFCPDF